MQVSSLMRRWLAGMAGLSLLAGSLVACGDSDSGKTADGLTKVTVLRSSGSTFEPLYIAQDQGYFKSAGLQVTIKAGASDQSQNAPSVLRGEAQFAMSDSVQVAKGAEAGLAIKIVSGLQSSTTAAPPSDGLAVPADSPIKSFADVGGKTIALPNLGGSIQVMSNYAAEQAGVNPSTIKYVALPLNSIVDSLNKGQVDGAYIFATFLDAARTSGNRIIGKGMNELPGFPQSILFAGSDWLKENDATAKKFVDAVAKAIAYANTHPDDVRAIDTKYTQLPPNYIKNRSIQPFSAQIDTETLKTVVSKMAAYKISKSAPDPSSLLWSGAPTGDIK
ncbi:ABC transporter substrate-binding protein [Actinomadura madurae]|uniref:NitT/TauT family transport system substrate-binding protein n=1 Tax=Actinomadura madurae TaxID=1993 RepID=A0A1I5PTC6_9ACTN|nr:ABC transporter substrate-binding protein [Actinomadura madurae]SFP37283.1 NitT/TauT family transport system substrate-binding protein [Actinomadura madurae]SPT64039.1 alkanesulfonate transporter substrate-binding subunit [Actinomadura madurae]